MEFSTITGVVLDRHEQIRRSAIVQEEHALTNAQSGAVRNESGPVALANASASFGPI